MTGPAMIFKAFGAIYWLIIARAERYFSCLSAFGANYFKHFTSSVGTAKVAILTLAFVVATALRATAGVTGKTFGIIKLLFTGCKNESFTTVTAS